MNSTTKRVEAHAGPSETMSGSERFRAGWGFLLVFVLLAAGILATGLFYYRDYERHFRDTVEANLSAIADLKVGEFARWRRERLGAARMLFRNPSFTELVRRFLAGDPDAGQTLQKWVNGFDVDRQYDRAWLLDAEGVLRLPLGDGNPPPGPVALKLASETLSSGTNEPAFLDFYRDPRDQRVYLAIAIPILDDRGGDRPLGVLLLRIDPETFVYPFIRRWPTPSLSAETLLVRREGDQVLFLNELRFEKGTALSKSLPMDRLSLPAVQAVLGHEGIVEGVDYRDEPVISAVRTVPDSPWGLVARVDSAEIYGPLRERVRLLVVLLGALLFGAGAGVGLIWRQHRVEFYRAESATQALAERALREMSEEQAALIQNLRAGFVVHGADSAILDTNEEASNLLGLSFDQMLGKTAADPAWSFLGDDGNPVPLAEYPVNRVLSSGGPIRNQVVGILRPDREEPTWVMCNAHPLRDAEGRLTRVYVNFVDITELKRAKEAIALQSRLAGIFLTVPDDEMYVEVLNVVLEVLASPFGVFGYIDAAGALVVPTMTREVRDRCQVSDKQFRFPRDTWGDSSWPQAIRQKRANLVNEASTRAPAGHVPITRHISLPIVFQGEVIGLFQVANKPTDYSVKDLQRLEGVANHVAPLLSARLARERAEDGRSAVLAELEERVSSRTAQLEAANAEMEAFTSSVSHDLRAPLRGIEGFAALVVEEFGEILGGEGLRLLGTIRATAGRMSQLIDDLLAFSRNGRVEIKAVRVSMGKLARSAFDEATGDPAALGRIDFTVGDLPDAVGDPALLRQLWVNLLSNAVKFSARRERAVISVSGALRGARAEYAVRDNGAGFDMRYVGKLFRVFERLHTEEEFEGTGIGLALARRIVARHGGQIRAEGSTGEGAAFFFTLPAAAGASAP